MAKAKAADKYVILHETVGAHQRGAVVEAGRLVPDEGGGVHEAHLQRLLDLGAIAPESSNEAQAAQAEVAPPEQQS